MVKSNGDRKGIGNFLLSAYIDRYRQPTFLHRNLEQALSYHDALLKGEVDKRWVTMAAASNNRVVWDIPSNRKTLNRLVEKRQPDFRLDVKRIRASNGTLRSSDLPTRKRAKFAPIACDIQVTISRTPKSNSESRDNDAEVICLRDSRAAQLLFREATDAAPAEFSVVMEPIVLSTNKLELPIGKDDNWRSGLSEAYEVAICVRFKTSQDAGLFRSLSQHFHGAEQSAAGLVHSLSATWKKFPLCPPADQLLPLSTQNHASKKLLSLGLAVSMGFKSGNESPLSMYNRAVRAKNSGTPRENTGVARTRDHRGREILDEIVINGASGRALARQVRIGYTSPPQEGFVVERGYCCTICKERRFPSREQLLHHIQNTYYFLDVRVRTRFHPSEAKLKLDCIIELEFKKTLTEEGSNATISKDIDFLAPKQPFDIVKHLSGANGWGKNPDQGRRTDEMHASRGSRIAHDHATARPSMRFQSTGIRSRTIADTPDLPTKPRLTRPVPRIAKGMVLFRSSSKRPLIEGEELSESDDDIDTGWFKPRRDLLVASSELPDARKKFAIMWNDYFEDRERLSGDVYMGEATIRFLRANTKAILSGHLEAELEARLAPLVETSVIREEVRQHAREILEQAKKATNTTPTAKAGRSRRVVSQEGPRVFEDDTANGIERPTSATRTSNRRSAQSSSHPHARASFDPMDIDTPTRRPGSRQGASSHPPPSSPQSKQPALAVTTCLCGKSAESMRTAIHCSNLDCRQPVYHMSCVGMTTKDPRWRCPQCRPSAGQRDVMNVQ